MPGSRDIRGGFDIKFDEQSQLLLNDGRGTKAGLALANAQLMIGDPGVSPNNTWSDSLRKDTIPPEEFTVELHRDENIIGGKYFVAFFTLDKQSGIDHFEVMESQIGKDGYQAWDGKQSSWRSATSPYILKDQSLNSTISVKAIDKAGNSRTAVFVPDESMRQMSMSSKLKLLFYSIFFAIPILSPFIVRRYRRKKTEDLGILISSDFNKKE